MGIFLSGGRLRGASLMLPPLDAVGLEVQKAVYMLETITAVGWLGAVNMLW